MGSKGLNLIKGLNLKSGMMGGGSATPDPRMKRFSDTILEVGDMLFFDKVEKEYVVVKKYALASIFTDGYDHGRYETNYDNFIGVTDGMAKFVACDDAMPTQSLYDNDVAATSCFYRIEIDKNVAGSIAFSVASGNGSISETTIEWEAGDAMPDIVAKFTALNQTSNYITFAALNDNNGVGLEVGGYGANTMTLTDSVNCTVIDCSTLAFYRSDNPTAPSVGDTLDPTGEWNFIGDTHHNWRGTNASAILTRKDLVGVSQVLVAVNGFNYSYRCGGNFGKFKSWATSSGDNTFYADGVNGSTNLSTGHVMRKTIFDSSVTSEATGDALLMYEYYNHLLTDASGDYATLREGYEAKYGTMETLYDAYLMSHMADPGGNSGIVNSMRNKGKHQTEVKADAMNVNYNYIVIPAYPPEYNAVRYGNASTIGFRSGKYYHPELGDIALFMRDDVFAGVNSNISMFGVGSQLTTSVSGGSCADYNAYTSWFFYSTNGWINGLSRYGHSFRSRPVLALPLQD